MAVVKVYYNTRADGTRLYKSYSDKGETIRKVGTDEVYSEAVDIDTAQYTYEETGEKIERQGEIL